ERGARRRRQHHRQEGDRQADVGAGPQGRRPLARLRATSHPPHPTGLAPEGIRWWRMTTMSWKPILVLPALSLLVAAESAAGAPNSAPAPRGWFAAGSRPQDYAMGIDRQRLRDGKATGYIKSVGE